jgi:serine/threonine-protein kinase
VSGEQFGPYRLDGLLGRGGMGEVLRAYDTERNRTVALKRMPHHLGDDAAFRSRFTAEARVAARMRNPHVIPIHDYGQIDGRPFIDMRLVDGEDLESRIKRRGPLDPAAAVTLVSQVASALDAAHAEALVHRDVKPSNVLLTEPDDFVYLIDFGLARELAAPRVTSTGVTFGTLAYMAPERFDGAGDYRVDVYALACVLYEALTGVPPFRHQDFLAIMHAHLTTPPPRPSLVRPGVPPALDAVVARGMDKDPARRFQRAGELAAAAKAALTAVGRPVQRPVPPPVPHLLPAAPPVSGPRPSGQPGRSRPPGVLAGLVIAPIVVIALVLLVVLESATGGGPEPAEPAPTTRCTAIPVSRPRWWA